MDISVWRAMHGGMWPLHAPSSIRGKSSPQSFGGVIFDPLGMHTWIILLVHSQLILCDFVNRKNTVHL